MTYRRGRRLFTFADIDSDGVGFTDADVPSGSLHQQIGEYFRQYGKAAGLTSDEWAAAEARYCMDASIAEIARSLDVSTTKVDALLELAIGKLTKYGLKHLPKRRKPARKPI